VKTGKANRIIVGITGGFGTGKSMNIDNSDVIWRMETDFSFNIWIKKVGTESMAILTKGGSAYSYTPIPDTMVGQYWGVNGGTLTVGGWSMVTVTRNATHTTIYMNGTYFDSAALNNPSGDGIDVDLGDGSNIGEPNFDGLMDEMGVWNRSLSDSEISELYNNGSGISYNNVFASPPTIPVQLLPTNSSNFEMDSTINFVWSNSTDNEGDTLTYDLEIYNESNMAVANLIHSNTSIAEGTENTSISIKLSDYTTQDDDYYWRVRANDSELVSNWSDVRIFQYANWTIIFNLTDGDTGEQIDTAGPQSHFDISCDNGFNSANVDNPYTATDFGIGTIECTFSELRNSNDELYFSKTENLTIDSEKTIKISMSKSGGLTAEEHTWLEWLYNCWNGGNCKDLLENINETTTNTWKRITKTDRAVVTQEDFISNTLNSNSNITLNYTVEIPYKAGYDEGEYLPLRLFFWFTNAEKTQCYNQDKTTSNRAEDPYCFPLMAETLGPNNGSVTFTVDLRPNLADGTYNVTRAIEIDPIVDGKQVWTNYGQEDIGQAEVEESNENILINFDTTNEVFPALVTSSITGAIIGATQTLLVGWQLVLVIAIIGLVLIVFIISKTLVRLKN